MSKLKDNVLQTADALQSFNLHIPTRTYKLFGPITEEAFNKFADACLLLSQSDDPINIFLNSPGGSVVDGFAIYDLISSLENHVTITVFGEAASIAAIILQAADLRLIMPHARVMLHDGSVRIDDMVARDFDKLASAYKSDRAAFYEILSRRSGKPRDYYRKKLAHDWHLTAKQAVEERLVDHIILRKSD